MDASVSVLQPIETAQGLPNGYYTNPVMFQIEKQQMFALDRPGTTSNRHIFFINEWRNALCGQSKMIC